MSPEQIARNEVYALASRLVEYCLTRSHDSDYDGPVDFDDVRWVKDLAWSDCDEDTISTAYAHEFDAEDGRPHADVGAMIEALTTAGLKPSDCDIEGDAVEINQWWSVSDWLASELRNRGEIVVSDGYTEYWGRTSGGQNVADDGVIVEIARDY